MLKLERLLTLGLLLIEHRASYITYSPELRQLRFCCCSMLSVQEVSSIMTDFVGLQTLAIIQELELHNDKVWKECVASDYKLLHVQRPSAILLRTRGSARLTSQSTW